MSVVIPARNAARYLRRALDSALGQTVPPAEIIVVDDGSTDATGAIAAAYGAPVRCLRVAAGGAARARNTGICAAHGQTIAFLDADDVWLPAKLDRQLALAREHPGASLIYSAVTLVDEHGARIKDIACPPLCRGHRAALRLRIKNCIQVSSVLAPRAALLAVGLYDPELAACENWDLWIRLAEHGAVVFTDTPLVLYRMRPQSTIRDVDRMRAARLQVLDRHHRDRSRRVRRRALALAYLDSGIGYLEVGRRRDAVADLLLALRLRPGPAPLAELGRAALPVATRRALGRLRRGMRRRFAAAPR